MIDKKQSATILSHVIRCLPHAPSPGQIKHYDNALAFFRALTETASPDVKAVLDKHPELSAKIAHAQESLKAYATQSTEVRQALLAMDKTLNPRDYESQFDDGVNYDMGEADEEG